MFEPKFKRGDIITTTENLSGFREVVTIGDVLEVEAIDSYGYFLRLLNTNHKAIIPFYKEQCFKIYAKKERE